MFRARGVQKELMDDLELNETALIANLEEIEKTNRWFGSNHTIVSALNKIYKKNPNAFRKNELIIADIGCGGGDLLRLAHKWAEKRSIKIKLLGIDANTCILNYAVEKTRHCAMIEYHKCNILSKEFKAMRFDIVMLNSFCHHFDDVALEKLLSQLQDQSSLAVIINDLHRHWLPYWSIKLISKWLNFSYLAQHDGPVSVLKAFIREDFTRLIKAMQSMPSHNGLLPKRSVYDISWRWAFRWQVIIWCNHTK